MHEEQKFADQFKKKSKRSKAAPSLSIPDPIDIFKQELLNRPPSVPILGRRLSHESILNNRDESSPILHPKLPFRQYRRKSIPDRLHKKPPISHRKSESKLKAVQKHPETKPPLDKSSKIFKIKSSKNLIKKSNFSTPHLNKFKHVLDRASVNEIEKRRVENITPSKIIRKNSDGKECEEYKKSGFEHRNLIAKHDVDRTGKSEKPVKSVHKASKSALSMRYEEKGKKVKKIEAQRISPPKKRRGKKSECGERSSSHSKINRIKVKETYVKKSRKLSNEPKPKPKLAKKLTKKKIHIKKKIKEPREDFPEQWLEHSFFLNTRNKQVETLEFEDRSDEDQLAPFRPSDLQSSNDFQLNLSIPSNDERFSKISSIANFSLPDSSVRPKSPLPDSSSQSHKAKIYKKPPKNPFFEQAANQIQQVLSTHLLRKTFKTLENVQSDKNKHALRKLDLDLNPNTSNEVSEDDEVRKIIGEIQSNLLNSPESQLRFPDEFLGRYEENTEKSDYQAPKPAEIRASPKTLTPVSPGVQLRVADLSKRLKQEQKTIETLEKDSKEVENLLYLDSLKQKKASIDDLRKRDLEAIKKITPKSGSESEIFEIFQSIINRRYETINSMFDDNIKAVQEALAQPVLTEESFSLKSVNSRAKDLPLQTSETVTLSAGATKKSGSELSVKSVNFQATKVDLSVNAGKFAINLEKCEEVKGVYRDKSPEIECEFPDFFSIPQPARTILHDAEVGQYKARHKSAEGSSSIVWIDEVAMPSNIDLSDMLIESSISDLYQILLSDILDSLYTVPADYISSLSEELILAILSHEIHSKIQEMRKDYDEESILDVIQKVFIKTQNLIVTELLKPLEKDPLAVLSEIQESEIGCGFLPEEKYAMLNFEAFQDDLSCDKLPVKIFTTMVFDCINESLEKLIVKEDLPWATERQKKVLVRTSEEVVNYIVNRLVRFSEIRAGEIIYEQLGAGRSEKEISDKRENDVVKMLAIEVVEDEDEWVKYEKEELQAKLDLADMILEEEIDGIAGVLFNDRN